jgi:hypothetical protein
MRTGERSCQNEGQCRRPGGINAQENRQPPKRVNLCMRRFAESGEANTERDRRSRQLQSACPRQGAPEFRFVRQRKERPRQRPVEALNTRMRRVRASDVPDGGRVLHVRYRGRSNVNRAVRPRAQRCPNKREARLRAALPRPALLRPAKPQKPKARRAALRRPKRQRGRERVDGSALLDGVCPRRFHSAKFTVAATIVERSGVVLHPAVRSNACSRPCRGRSAGVAFCTAIERPCRSRLHCRIGYRR